MAKKLIDTHSKIVGVTKLNDKGKDIQKILSKLKPDTKLVLIREPDNPYSKDGSVTKIYANNKHIGYIKSDLAKKIAPLLDKGHKCKVTISEITGGICGKNFGCNYQITVYDKGILEKLFNK